MKLNGMEAFGVVLALASAAMSGVLVYQMAFLQPACHRLGGAWADGVCLVAQKNHQQELEPSGKN